MSAVIEGELVNVPAIPKPLDVEPLAAGVIELARNTVVTTREDYERVSLLIADLKGRWNRIEAMRKKLKAPIDAAITAVQAFFNPPLGALAEAEKILKGKLDAYRAAEMRRIAEKEAADRKAREDADREARRLEEEAERSAAAAEKARRDADTAAKAGDREKAVAAARAALRAAKEAGAAKVQATEAQTVATAPVVREEPIKVAGQSVAKKYRFRVKDIRLVEAKWMMLNESSVQEFCDRMKDKAQEHLPGIEVYVEEITRQRAS